MTEMEIDTNYTHDLFTAVASSFTPHALAEGARLPKEVTFADAQALVALLDDEAVLIQDASPLALDVLRLMQQFDQWANHILHPPIDGDSPEQKAYFMYFNTSLSHLNTGEGVSLLDPITGEMCENSELVQKATSRLRGQFNQCLALCSVCREFAEQSQDDVLLSTVDGICNKIRKVEHMAIALKDVIVASIASLHAEMLISTNALHLVADRGKNNHGKVIYHVQQIMQRMYVSGLRRLVKLDYRPLDQVERNSAATMISQLDTVESIEGIYKAVRIEREPREVWFDVQSKQILGDRVNTEPAPLSVAMDQYSLTGPKDVPTQLGDFMRSPHFTCADFLEIWDDLLTSFFEGNLVIAIACQMPGCCDYMHCRDWVLKRASHWTHPQWCGRTQTEPFLSPSGADPLIGHSAHTFAPELRARKPIVTNVFSHFANVNQFIMQYFAPGSNPYVEDALIREVISSVENWGEHLAWSEDLEIKPNRHVYAFADGILVADPQLEPIPRFYRYDSHVFHPQQKYGKLFTVKTELSQCFRPEMLQQMLQTVLPPPPTTCGDMPRHRCGVCGLLRDQCVACNLHMTAHSEAFRTAEDYVAPLRAVAHSFNHHELINMMAATTGERAQFIDQHTFQPCRQPVRDDALPIATRVDLTQFDEIILTQIEHPNMWDQLPSHLRDLAAPCEFHTQIQQLNTEIRAVLGRLLFRNKEFATTTGVRDNWQAFLFIKGASGTGKSTIANVVSRLIGRENVGIIDCATWEPQFGLSQVINADMTMVNEMAGKINFSPNTVLQMVDGSQMSAPRKNKKAAIGPMRGPLLLLGNQAPQTGLTAGQWQRRELMLGFERTMAEARSKPNMEKEIIALHLGHLAFVLYTAYIGFMEKHGSQDLWRSLSWQWHHQRRRSECQSNVLGKILGKLREMSANVEPQIHLHTDPAMMTQFQRLLRSSDWPKTSDGIWSVQDIAPSPELRRFFGTVQAGQELTPSVPYMPFESTLLPDNGSGEENLHLGFKHLCNQTLQSLSGTRSVINLPWQNEEDFYRSAFDADHLFIYEGKLPYPPWSSHLVNSKWLIGVSDVAMFKMGNGDLHPSFRRVCAAT